MHNIHKQRERNRKLNQRKAQSPKAKKLVKTKLKHYTIRLSQANIRFRVYKHLKMFIECRLNKKIQILNAVHLCLTKS